MEQEDARLPISNKKIRSSRDLIFIPFRAVVLFFIGTLTTAILFELWPIRSQFLSITELTQPSSLKYAIFDKRTNLDHLVHVFKVLKLFGYTQVNIEEDWDLLWAHDYPFFQLKQRMKELKSHQIVNHLPGCGFLTNKVDLSTSNLPHLPRAFRLPKDKDAFKAYAAENPDALFVEKHNEHREIYIKQPGNISLESKNTFVQEYIQNPFLVDGYKFDMGVYVVITSIDPLRMYVYTADVLFRYCTEQYYPFDANNVKKYVVGDDYLPTWKVQSLVKYYKRFSGSMRGSFDAYVRDQGLNPAYIWHQVEDIIRETVLAKEADIARIIRSYNTKNFFDLLRFDLIIDENLKVHLIEANMSPNLSSAHFKPNSLLYEQILFSALQLVGIGSPIRDHEIFDFETPNPIVTSDKNLATNLNLCAENDCDSSCSENLCNLCLTCLSGSDYLTLAKAHREHLQRADMKRIFPKQILNPKSFDIVRETQNLTSKNKWMTQWFYNKCLYDESWCI